MHFKNENEINSNQNHKTTNTTTSTSCSSSTDSGVIIIDNETTFNNSDNNGSSSNNSNSHNISSNNNNTSSSKVTKDNNSSSSRNEETQNDTATTANTTKTINNDEKLNINKNITVNNISDKSNNINIENIVNITNTNGSNNGRRQQKTSSKNCSPTVSIRSTSISIVSIDENAIDSSVVDSDSDFDPDADDYCGDGGGGGGSGGQNSYIVKKLGQQTTFAPDSPDLTNIINNGMKVISQQINPSPGPIAENMLNGGAGVLRPPTTPQIGSIALSNSTDVTFGDKHFYSAPVTIQQFLIDSRDKWKSENNADGQDNPAFTGECDNTAAAKANSPPSQQQQPYKFIFNRKAIIITGTIIVLTILIGILIITTSSIFNPSKQKSKLIGDGDDSRKNIPINSTIDDEYAFNGSLNIIKRNDWMARAASGELASQKLPLHRLIISHTASEGCDSRDSCDYRVQVIQNFHMDSNSWDDIGYNFLIGGDGLVYEGRGWDKQGAHTKGYNIDSLGISFIGTFTQSPPTPNQLKATQLLIDDGVRQRKLAPDYKLFGARQLGATESPGEALYRILKTWPHWSQAI